MALALSKLLVTGWSAGPLASQSVIQLVGRSVSWLVLFHLAFCMETLFVMACPLLLSLAFVLFRKDCMVCIVLLSVCHQQGLCLTNTSPLVVPTRGRKVQS